MRPLRALAGGLAGACALTLLHEVTRRTVPDAPRMDVLGERAWGGGLGGAGVRAPRGARLHTMALAGDVVANSLYYSLAGVCGPASAPACGAILGLAAGVGAVALPGPMGLGEAPSNRTGATQLM